MVAIVWLADSFVWWTYTGIESRHWAEQKFFQPNPSIQAIIKMNPDQFVRYLESVVHTRDTRQLSLRLDEASLHLVSNIDLYRRGPVTNLSALWTLYWTTATYERSCEFSKKKVKFSAGSSVEATATSSQSSCLRRSAQWASPCHGYSWAPSTRRGHKHNKI